MSTKILWKFSTLLFALILLGSCKKQFDEKQEDVFQNAEKNNGFDPVGFVENDMVLHWNENVSKVVAVTAGPPPVVTRHFIMTQIAVYDALNSIKPKYKTYALLNTREKNADPDAAVASAAYWTFKKLDAYLKTLTPSSSLPLQTSGNDWDAWYANSLSGIAAGDAKDDGIALGILAADAIMAKRADDNYPTARVNYPPPYVPIPLVIGQYRQTFAAIAAVPANHNGGLPLWGTQMKTFAGMSNDQFRSAPPPSVLSGEYTTDYNEVKSIGARVGSTRTDDQSIIANFWEETPVNIWNRFCRNVILTKKIDAWRTARLLAMVNTGIFDGFVTSFDGLFHFYRWRPESAIQSGDIDGNDQTAGIVDWFPFVTNIKPPVPNPNPAVKGAYTPPIPDYPNPNAAIGSAVAKILQLFFETDKTDVSLTTQDVTTSGTTRNYYSFSQAKNENFDSRIYAGFNFRFSMNAGDQIGKEVASYIFDHVFGENDE